MHEVHFSKFRKWINTSSNQTLGKCVRPKMDNQVVAKGKDCLACVASVPVQAKCYCVAYERRFWSRENWGESKKGKGTGLAWGSERTLAGKPHDSEKRPPISSRVSSLIDDILSVVLFFSESHNSII